MSDNLLIFSFNLYIYLLPVILGGVLNMAFCKTPFFKKHTKPIDREMTLYGKRIFGNNKTTLGFLGMVVFTALAQVVWGYLCMLLNIDNIIYLNLDNNIINNIVIGGLLGFTYVLMELPNSFFKRRLDINSGESKLLKNKVFLIIDQIDSLIGIGLVLIILSEISFAEFLATVIVGGVTHILINTILVKLKLKGSI